ncbi:hypothetical protein Ddye_000600 [Dipteronia dyeriana]|uniref:Transposase MuDR plant domain-containing protein n=1 Tax=Dipteronia dyeriana TaxID=168575 RepID=A0AAD9XLZ2_9ROSI|nr:hypothetical protein Ddye_000600 [Dipteronia dyeriana]
MLSIPSEIKVPLTTNMKRVSKIEKMLTNVSLCVPNLRKELGSLGLSPIYQEIKVEFHNAMIESSHRTLRAFITDSIKYLLTLRCFLSSTCFSKVPKNWGSDDNSIPDVDRGSHDDEDCHNGVGCGSESVGGHGCAGPSGFATCSGVSFREDGLGDDVNQTFKHASPRAWVIPEAERYSFEPISTEEACSDDGRLYKDRIFHCKKDLKQTLNMYALKEGFDVWIRRSIRTRYEAGCKDEECEFHLRGIKMQKGEYWEVRMFLKDHTSISIVFMHIFNKQIYGLSVNYWHQSYKYTGTL